MSTQRVTCPECGYRRVARSTRKTDVCRSCLSEMAGGSQPSHGLPPGAWRFNPFARRLEYVAAPPTEKPRKSRPAPRTFETINHGTDGGYKQHIRAKVPFCGPCREAHSAYQAEEEQRRYEMGDPKLRCACGSRKNARSVRCNTCARAARRGVSQVHNQRRKEAA